jgi:dihydrofolate reductase
MGKIVVSENVSLDGVVEDPAGEEGFTRGGWFLRVGDRDREEWAQLALSEALGAQAWLLGRRSYEYFAARWPSRRGALAVRLNSLPKYVISTSLGHPDWSNTTILRGGAVDEVLKLKQAIDGEIVVPASRRLVHTLLEHNLVDELRLIVYPEVLGAGERLFGETSDSKPMRLVTSQTVGESLARLTYEMSRES